MQNITLSISQLGYTPGSTKQVSLLCKDPNFSLPEKVNFYIQDAGSRLRRSQKMPDGWNGKFFRWPFLIGSGKTDGTGKNEKSHTDKPLFEGTLVKTTSRWGNVWQGDFSEFTEEGIYQIETEYQMTVPFEISQNIYQRGIHSYLNYIYAQRSGFEIPGIRTAQHLDDAILDSTGEQIDATAGWYDAGDYRKWLSLTQGNLKALANIATCGIPLFEQQARDEIHWGNRFFHSMVNPEGQVYEDVGGGTFKDGLDIEKDWWYENHPGCNCDNAGNIHTDNQPGTGDERLVRTFYNPFIQFQFIYYQGVVSEIFEGEYAQKCQQLALKAWEYGLKQPHDNRTLFLCTQLLAAAEIHKFAPEKADISLIESLTEQLLARQNKDTEGISGYFTEKGNTDGFRSIAFSTFPIQAVLHIYKMFPQLNLHKTLKESIYAYIENYLLTDARSNPFSVIPYGVYHQTPFSSYQTFRDAGKGRYIRSFIHPINSQEIIHGTNSVIIAHAAFLAEVSHIFNESNWRHLAEKLIHWGMGHNTEGLSLFTGIGYKHPVLFSGVHVQIPYAACAGYIGTPEDKPYLETSNWIEWSTQEVWDVPHYEMAIASINLLKPESTIEGHSGAYE